MSEDTRYEAWFLHEKLAVGLLSPDQATEVSRRLPRHDQPLGAAMRVSLLERALASYVAGSEVGSLDVEHLHERLNVGRVVWLEQAIAFKGVAAALTREKEGIETRASFSAPLSTDKSIRIRGSFNVNHLTSSTAASMLSGTRRQFILGYVESRTREDINLRPIVIATRWLRPSTSTAELIMGDGAHIWPGAVDQFGGVDFTQRLRPADLTVLRDVPERSVKVAFASILGEPVVANDWGGEQFDLWTPNRLSVDGRQLRAAFLLKGPARFRPMTIADLGKNGDQIDRMAHTAADVLVLQHCHSITAPVVNMLRIYATHPSNRRQYMVIDGYDTIRILRHFGHLSSGASVSPSWERGTSG